MAPTEDSPAPSAVKKIISGQEDTLGAELEALVAPDAAQSAESLLALSVHLDIYELKFDIWAGPPKKVANKTDFFKGVIAFMQKAPKLQELRLDNLTYISNVTKVDLRHASFKSVTALQLLDIPEGPLVMRALPNLNTVTCSYPGTGVKNVLQTIHDRPNITNVALRSESWSAKQIEDVVRYLPNVKKLCLFGEAKAKVTELAPYTNSLVNLTHLEITIDPWVNEASLAKRYADDGLLNAIDDAKEYSRFNEDALEVATALFKACQSLVTLRLLHRFFATEYTVQRDDAKQGGVEITVSDEFDMGLRYKPLGTHFDYFARDMRFDDESVD